MTAAVQPLEFYAPDQPRDERGRFGEGSGGSATKEPNIQKAVQELSAFSRTQDWGYADKTVASDWKEPRSLSGHWGETTQPSGDFEGNYVHATEILDERGFDGPAISQAVTGWAYGGDDVDVWRRTYQEELDSSAFRPSTGGMAEALTLIREGTTEGGVWRGEGYNPHLEVGDIVPGKLTSWSRDEDVAKVFALGSRDSTDPKDSALMYIPSTSAVHGIDIAPLGAEQFAWQKEVIVGEPSYTVTDVRTSPLGVPVYEVRPTSEVQAVAAAATSIELFSETFGQAWRRLSGLTSAAFPLEFTFDPSQPRDDDGKWTSGGEGIKDAFAGAEERDRALIAENLGIDNGEKILNVMLTGRVNEGDVVGLRDNQKPGYITDEARAAAKTEISDRLGKAIGDAATTDPAVRAEYEKYMDQPAGLFDDNRDFLAASWGENRREMPNDVFEAAEKDSNAEVEWARSLPGFPTTDEQLYGEAKAREYVDSWAGSAADNSPTSLSLQNTTQEELNAPSESFAAYLDEPSTASPLAPGEEATMSVFVRSEYEATQSWLRDQGIGPDDPVQLQVEDRNEAEALGRKYDQQAIWDNVNQEPIDVGGTGGRTAGATLQATQAGGPDDGAGTSRLGAPNLGSDDGGTLSVLTRLQRAEFYSEDQPRDADGRWGSGPGDGLPPRFRDSVITSVTFLASGKADYIEQHGLPRPEAKDWAGVTSDPVLGNRIAADYEAMPLYDRTAEGAYDQLATEVGAQYQYLTETLGVKVDFLDHDPYENVNQLRTDLEDNHHLSVLQTEVTGSHPYLTDAQNDQFRAVHDAFGHAAIGRGFDRNGEEAAFQSHAQMFTPLALEALASETRGQNNAMIYGNYAEGEFPPQKFGLLPPEDVLVHEPAPYALAAAGAPPSADDDNMYDVTGVHHASLGRRLPRVRAAAALEFYAPDQPRDERGRFGETGASSGDVLPGPDKEVYRGSREDITPKERREIVNGLRDAFPAASVVLDEYVTGEHIPFVRAEAQALTDLAERYPNAVENVQQITFTADWGVENDGILGMVGREYNDVDAPMAMTLDVGELSLMAGGPPEAFEPDIVPLRYGMNSEDVDWVRAAYGVATHEFGHLIGNTYGDDALQEKFLGWAGNTATQAEMDELVATTPYAASSYGEAFAEVFAAQHLGVEGIPVSLTDVAKEVEKSIAASADLPLIYKDTFVGSVIWEYARKPMTASVNLSSDGTVHDGVMVAWVPPRSVAEALALPGGEDAQRIHLTLVYLGKASEMDPSQVTLANDVVASLASSFTPFTAEVSGTGFFDTEDGTALVALIDAPELPELYDALCEALESVGLPVSHTHGFTPHMTLAYIDSPNTDRRAAAGTELRIDALSVVAADDSQTYEMGGTIASVQPLEFGDSEGHPFRGNQYTGGHDVSLKEAMDDPQQFVGKHVTIVDVKRQTFSDNVPVVDTVHMNVVVANRVGGADLAPGMNGAGLRLGGVLTAPAFGQKEGEEFIFTINDPSAAVVVHGTVASAVPLEFYSEDQPRDERGRFGESITTLSDIPSHDIGVGENVSDQDLLKMWVNGRADDTPGLLPALRALIEREGRLVPTLYRGGRDSPWGQSLESWTTDKSIAEKFSSRNKEPLQTLVAETARGIEIDTAISAPRKDWTDWVASEGEWLVDRSLTASALTAIPLEFYSEDQQRDERGRFGGSGATVEFNRRPSTENEEGTQALEAVRNGKVVGHAFYDEYPTHILVLQLSVDPEWRRQGVGTALLRELQATGKSISAEDFIGHGEALWKSVFGKSTTAAAQPLEFYSEDQPRDEHGRWSSDGGLPSDPRERIPAVTALVEQALKDGKATEDVYDKLPGGRWTAEREALHHEIVQDILARNPNVDHGKEAIILGGIGGSGKTTLLDGGYLGIDSERFLTISPDQIKEELAMRGEVPEIPGVKPMEENALVHEEASKIAYDLANVAVVNDMNVVWDVTMSSPRSVLSRMEDLNDEGYNTRVMFANTTLDVAQQRAEERYIKNQDSDLGGRLLLPALYTQSTDPAWGTVNRSTFEAVKSQANSWEVWDTSGSTPVFVERSQP